MRYAKKPMLIGAAALVVILLAAGTLIPAKTSITRMDADKIPETPYAQVYKELQSKNERNGDAEYGDLWVLERTYFGGRKQEIAMTPCVRFTVRDVGTAGTSTWVSEFELLSSGKISVDEVKAHLTADDNTGLYFSGFPDGYASSMDLKIGQEDSLYTAAVHASTVDSSIEPDKDCAAQVLWTADVSIFGISTPYRVEMACDAGYRNNVK